MLIQLLLLFLCMPTIKYLLSVPIEGRDEETKHTFRSLFRKQFTMPAFFLGNIRPKDKPETFYEPYWSNGDWVFYRKESTRRPRPFSLNDGYSTQNDECNQMCSKIVQDYGPVCGARYNSTSVQYDQKTFEDYCYLELENCGSVSKNWFPIKKGDCTVTKTTQIFNVTIMITRASDFLHDIDRTDAP